MDADGTGKAPAECGFADGSEMADYLDGRIPGEDRIRIEKHIASCETCRLRMADLALLIPALKSPAGAGADAAVPERVDEAIAALAASSAGRSAARGRILSAFAAAAAAVALLASGYLTGSLRLAARDGAAPESPPASTGTGNAGAPAGREKEVTDLMREVQSLKELAAAHQKRADDAESLLSAAAVGAEEQGRRLAGLESEIRGHQGVIGALKADLEASAAVRGRYEEALKAREAAVEDLRTRLEEHSASVRDLESRLSAARENTLAMEKRIADLESPREVRGDWNGDGSADIVDALAICGSAARGGETPFKHSADMNGDGVVDVGDAVVIAGLAFSEK